MWVCKAHSQRVRWRLLERVCASRVCVHVHASLLIYTDNVVDFTLIFNHTGYHTTPQSTYGTVI
jgi:hypothetical protein